MKNLYPFPAGCSFRLVLLRHGEPSKEVHGRCYGTTDAGLSDIGREQIRNKLDLLQCLKVNALYTSPCKRAVESALIADSILGLSPQTVPELSEINFGAFEGLTYEEIERLYPEPYRLWMERPTEITFPDGESFAVMKQRVLGFVRGLSPAHPGHTVLIVAHGGVNRAILADALGMPNETAFRLDQAHAATSMIDYFADSPVVTLINV